MTDAEGKGRKDGGARDVSRMGGGDIPSVISTQLATAASDSETVAAAH